MKRTQEAEFPPLPGSRERGGNCQHKRRDLAPQSVVREQLQRLPGRPWLWVLYSVLWAMSGSSAQAFPEAVSPQAVSQFPSPMIMSWLEEEAATRRRRKEEAAVSELPEEAPARGAESVTPPVQTPRVEGVSAVAPQEPHKAKTKAKTKAELGRGRITREISAGPLALQDPDQRGRGLRLQAPAWSLGYLESEEGYRAWGDGYELQLDATGATWKPQWGGGAPGPEAGGVRLELMGAGSWSWRGEGHRPALRRYRGREETARRDRYESVWGETEEGRVKVRFREIGEEEAALAGEGSGIVAGQLEYDLLLEAGYSPEELEVRFVGAETLRVEEGVLVVRRGEWELRHMIPAVWQEVSGKRVERKGTWELRGGDRAGFKVEGYDARWALVIDPVLSSNGLRVDYARWWGGSGEEETTDVLWHDGFVYFSGETQGGLPGGSQGAGSVVGEEDLYIGKLDVERGRLEWLSLLGGEAKGWQGNLARDGNGHICVGGQRAGEEATVSWQEGVGGGTDAYIACVNESDGSVGYSGELGGTGGEWVTGIWGAGEGELLLVGGTDSEEFGGSGEGGTDLWVAKVKEEGVEWLVRYGGEGGEEGYRVVQDKRGKIWVAGVTSSESFAWGEAEARGSLGGDTDGLVLRLTEGTGALELGVYIGGSGEEEAYDLAPSRQGGVWVVGETNSADLGVNAGSLQSRYGGEGDGWLWRLDENGRQAYGSYVGGSGADRLNAVLEDIAGRVIVGGETSSQYLLSASFQRGGWGISDGWLGMLRKGERSWEKVLRIGGYGREQVQGLSLDGRSQLWVAGVTESEDSFPYVGGEGSGGAGGSKDAFLLQVEQENRAPVVVGSLVGRGSMEERYEESLEGLAVDPEGEELTWRVRGGPAGLGVSEGKVFWELPEAGSYSVRLQVTDASGGVAEYRYFLEITGQANRAPRIESSAPLQAVVEEAYSYEVEATDPDGDPLSWELAEGPLGMQLNGRELSWEPSQPGEYAAAVVVSDPRGAEDRQEWRIAVVYPATDGPPVWEESPGSHRVEVGSRLRVILSARDPEGVPVEYGMSPLPLPAGASLNSRTGEFEFRPQEGNKRYELKVSANDGRFASTERLIVEVPELDPTLPTRLSGRVLDADSLAEGVEWPIVGMGVSILPEGPSTQTDAQGNFHLSGIPAGKQLLDFDPSTAGSAPGGAGYAGFREAFEFKANVHHREERPFTLPRLDEASREQVHPGRRTVVKNERLGVELIVEAGTARNEDGSLYTGKLWISEVPRGLAPAALPSTLDPRLLITIQPVGVSFSSPAKIRFRNDQGYAAGTSLELWSVDPRLGQFEVVGRLQVSRDGQWQETETGGIRAADWHLTAPGSIEALPSDSRDRECGEGACQEAGSTVNLGDGRLGQVVKPPPYWSQGEARGLMLRYRSSRADAMPRVGVLLRKGSRQLKPKWIKLKLDVGGVRVLDEVYLDVGLLPWPTGEVKDYLIQVPFKASGREGLSATGVYRYDLLLQSHYPREPLPAGDFRIIREERRSGGGGGNSFTAVVELSCDEWLDLASRPRVAISSPVSFRRISGPIGGGRGSGSTTRFSISAGSTFASNTGNGGSGIAERPSQAELEQQRGERTRAVTFPCGADVRATRLESWVMVVNEEKSPYGAGWSISGLWRLYPGFGKSQLLVRSEGRAEYLRWEKEEQSYKMAEGTYGELEELEAGGWIYREWDGTEREFNEQGLQRIYRDRNGNETEYEYDGAGKLTQMRDPVGEESNLSYRNGYLSHLRDPGGRVTRFQHDSKGNLVGVAYPDGSKESYGYKGRLMTSRRDERGNRTAYGYDRLQQIRRVQLADGTERKIRPQDVSGGIGIEGLSDALSPARPALPRERISRMSDGRGYATWRRYEANAQLVEEVDPLGRVISWERDKNGRPLKMTRANGSVVESRYDERSGRILSRRERTNGASWSFSYDSHGLPTRATDPRGNTTELERDAKGNVVKVRNALGHESSIAYDEAGLPIKLTDPNGQILRRCYDKQGRLERQSEESPNTAGSEPVCGQADHRAGLRIWSYEYDEAGRMTKTQTPEGVELTYSYDERNRLERVSDPAGQALEVAYDARGNVKESKLSNGDGSIAQQVSYAYDERNRLTALGMPQNKEGSEQAIQRWVLDKESNVEEWIDPRGNRVKNLYDAADRLSKSTHPLEGNTEFSYDELDRVVKISAPNGVVTNYEYDKLGRRTAEHSADRGTMHYSYDLANNLIAVEDARGIKMRMSYDKLNRITNVRYPTSAENVEYEWDNCAYGKGRLCGREDETGSYSYSYDAYGNLLEERHTIDGVTYTKSYSYDKEDRIARMTLPSGRVVEYSRDNVRRVRGISTEVNGQKQAIVSEITYRADGGRTGYLYGNGLSGQRLYDRQGRLLRQELGVRSAGTWSSKNWERHYQYDKNSNLVRRGPRPDESKQSYGYDALDRLEEERKAGPPDERQGYEYDLNGNRLRESGKQEIEHFLGKGSNRLRATEELMQTQEGEVEESSTSWRYEYNDAGRLKTVYQEGVKVSTYLYGADGLRRKKTVYEPNGSTVAKEIHYHYVSGLLVSETTATGTLLRDYLWNPDGSPLAQIEGSTPGNSQEQLLYLHTDHLLTPRRATNATGTNVWSWESSAFGKESPQQDPDGDGTLTAIQLRYPGQYHDAETGLYYNWHRYYNPSTGRYIQSELIGLAGGLNTYGYALQNPLAYIDPNGLDVTIVITRTGSTQNSISGTINVTSDVTNKTFNGHTLETLKPPNSKLPVPPGVYSAFIRPKKDDLDRIELRDVPDAKHIQIHNGNEPGEVIGCFLVGKTKKTDWVGPSREAMREILKLIEEDGGTENITVIIIGDP